APRSGCLDGIGKRKGLGFAAAGGGSGGLVFSSVARKVIHRLPPLCSICSLCSYVPDSKSAYFSLKIKHLTKTKTDKFNPKTDKFNPKTDKFNPEKSYPQAKN
ncbi:MAG: hypothetical protein WBO35_04335, partial [Candidatus Saccharimonadales bacterium]